MKAKSKALALVCCAVLLVVATVFTTVAYLTATTDSVVNTFTVGKVAITLDEAKVDLAGVKVDETRVKANSYKLMPGHTYIKDPTVHVDANSEECYLFVKVVNEIAAIEADTTIAAQMTTNGWTLVSGTTNVYAYNQTVSGTSADRDIEVFAQFIVKGTETADTLAAYEDKIVTVTAYAVQSDGLASADDAWTAANFS